MDGDDVRGEWQLAYGKGFNCRDKVPNGKIVHVFQDGDIIEVDEHIGNDWCKLAKPHILMGMYVRLRNQASPRRAWVRSSRVPVERVPVEYKGDLEIPEVSEVVRHYCGVGFMGVLVTRNGCVVHAKGYGSGTSKTGLRLLSLTKQFVAMCAAMLMEEGKLELKAKVSRYLPELGIPTNGRELLIQDLLWHTSGLPNFVNAKERASTNQYRKKRKLASLTNETHAEWLATMQPLAPAGHVHSYTNSGYVLLARVVEVIAGEPFHVFQKRRIFDVLGMSETTDSASFNGSGSIGTRLADYAKWDLALWREDKRLLTSLGYKMIFARGTLDDGNLVPYGFGWGLSHIEDRLVSVQHSGSGGGWANQVKRFIPGKTTVAIFAMQNPAFSNHTTRLAAVDEVFSVVQNLATTASVPLPLMGEDERRAVACDAI